MNKRRNFLTTTALGSGLIAAGALSSTSLAADKEKKVTANEDLMREHGVLRRALLVYDTVARRLQKNAGSVPATAVARTARLFRDFGEDYHERRLEQEFIFPVVRKLKGQASAYPDILQQQHERGRELTDYVMHVTQGGFVGSGNAGPLAKALRQFALMYENHAVREDTVVFTAWKDALPEKDYDEMGDKFEDIEKQVFGHDGFDDALKQIINIEQELGLVDLAQFTMPRPPKA